MSESFEVSQPILNSPYEEPKEHWLLRHGEMPQRLAGRRNAGYWYRRPDAGEADSVTGEWQELETVNTIRARMAEWRGAGRPGITRTTRELFDWWKREGRAQPLFFAQFEAAETIIFLAEARADYLQGISVPLDEPSEERKADGFKAFRRQGCKMATGSGKTTVMGMVAAWSILNKVANRSDGRFSEIVLAVCPNVTIRTRLGELDPLRDEASLYRTRDLVPPGMMNDLKKGRVIMVNWHVFEPQIMTTGGTSSRVSKAGVEVRTRETIKIGHKTTTQRGSRYVTIADLKTQVAAGILTILDEVREADGSLKEVKVEAVRYVESDAKLLERVLGREIGSRGNILVFNDEAHHAYRIRTSSDEEDDPDDEDDDGEDVDDYFVKEATVWVDGLDKIHKHRTINLCVDLSATPYYIGRVGNATNQVFPWVVSDFGLSDAIEAGLVKIPQLAVRDTTGADIPGYFNIWRWVLPKLTAAQRGGGRANPNPAAILMHAHTPIAMLGGLWEQERQRWLVERPEDKRPPVFILICKTTKIAKVVHEWIADDNPPTGVGPANLPELRNRDGKNVTIRVDTKVVEDTDSGAAKADDVAWMRFTLDTVGRIDWQSDAQGRPIYPEGFEALSDKLQRPKYPPGRDVRCIVSVGMLTEGWDCNTVTHVVGLRPFMSQLLCEQVVGRALRRTNYHVGEDGKLEEEVAKVFGVPFEVVPFRSGGGTGTPRPRKHHVRAIPEKAHLAITFPRVEGYQQAIKRKLLVDWDALAPTRLDASRIPPQVDLGRYIAGTGGPRTTNIPGGLETVSLAQFRADLRDQQLAFALARELTRRYRENSPDSAATHILFPQILHVVERYIAEKVEPGANTVRVDAFISPYWDQIVTALVQAIKPDESLGENPELPVLEKNRSSGSTAEVSFWTSRDVREVQKSHLNFIVADTAQWEQSAAYSIDTHPVTAAFVKNAGLGFAIPYLHNGEPHEYIPDFIIRLTGSDDQFLILETKGHDDLADVKAQAAQRWVAAVNAAKSYGTWRFVMARSLSAVTEALNEVKAAETV